MSGHDKIHIKKLATGVPGLDEILGGGLPEFSFNIIAGAPGSGKTTLAHQFMFANATPERPAIYFTVLGEPAIKMLRYQQQFTFFDQAKLNKSVRFINLSQAVLEKDLDAVLKGIVEEVKKVNPGVIVIDSFRTVIRKVKASSQEMELQDFVQQLALDLTSWQATTFLIGEYAESELRDNPVFTVADGLLWLFQQTERNSVVRKFQIMKLRGQASVPGLHSFRITENGIETYPRTYGLSGPIAEKPGDKRLSSGIKELDKMLNGGFPVGDSVLVSGPSGSGKSIIATEFIAEGIRRRESVIIAIFEERPPEYIKRAAHFGLHLGKAQKDGKLNVLYLRPLDLSVDETVSTILETVKRTGAKRIVLDSIAGLELALTADFRLDFRESIYRMIGALTRAGVTVLSTVEVEDSFNTFNLTNYAISFLCDDLIRLRYVEIEGQIRKALMIVKMRGGKHSNDIREYRITDKGFVLGDRFSGYLGLLTGSPEPLGNPPAGKKENPPAGPQRKKK